MVSPIYELSMKSEFQSRQLIDVQPPRWSHGGEAHMQGEMATTAQITAMKGLLLTSLVFVVSATVILTFFTFARDWVTVKNLASGKESNPMAKGIGWNKSRSPPLPLPPPPQPQPASLPSCDLFSGSWVCDNSSEYPLYSEKGCSFMSEIVACETFGRKDFGYRKWRWQPHSCDLPRFDPKALIEKLKGKRMVYVGDSLTWNQWVSMLCLLEPAIPSTHNTTFQSKGPIKVLRDTEYNLSIEHHWTPLLVESSGDDPVHNQFPHRIVRAESIVKHAKRWNDADFLVFDSYIWWKMPKIRLWWGPFNDSSNGVYKDVDSIRAFELTMKTWASWLEFHTNTIKTKIFFMSKSPTHSWAKKWGGESNHNCYGETEPISEYGYRGKDTADWRLERVAEEAIQGLRSRGVEVKLLNITQLSEYRRDAHPSIYRQFWDTVPPEKRGDPLKYADCTHWCLPGVPDVWNHLLYTYIIYPF